MTSGPAIDDVLTFAEAGRIDDAHRLVSTTLGFMFGGVLPMRAVPTSCPAAASDGDEGYPGTVDVDRRYNPGCYLAIGANPTVERSWAYRDADAFGIAPMYRSNQLWEGTHAIGADANLAELQRYFTAAADAAAEVGIETVPSPGRRPLPEDKSSSAFAREPGTSRSFSAAIPSGSAASSVDAYAPPVFRVTTARGKDADPTHVCVFRS